MQKRWDKPKAVIVEIDAKGWPHVTIFPKEGHPEIVMMDPTGNAEIVECPPDPNPIFSGRRKKKSTDRKTTGRR